MRTFFLSLFFGVAVLFVVPTISYGAGIVPCDGVDCQTCHAIELGSNILNWIIGVMATVCAVVIAVAGLKMATAGGNAGAVSAAKEMITNTVVGFIILLAAWLIVDTVMRVFVGDQVPNFGPWNQIQCVTQPVVTPTTQTGAVPSQCETVSNPAQCQCEASGRIWNLGTGTCDGTIGSVPAPTPGCPTCVTMPTSIPTNGNACSGACVMRPDMASALTSADLGSLGLRLSEGYPPVATHAEACHTRATCVDVSFSANAPSGQQVIAGTTALRAQGLVPVYEVPNAARRQELINAGVTNVIVVSGINREHYSVYDCQADPSPRACN